MKVKLATALTAASSLALSGCGGWITTDIGGGYYPDYPIYSGPSLPPSPVLNPLPPVVVNPGPVWQPYPGNGGNPGTGNRPGNGGNPGPALPSYGPNSGQGSRPISIPAQSSGGPSGSGATRTH